MGLFAQTRLIIKYIFIPLQPSEYLFLIINNKDSEFRAIKTYTNVSYKHYFFSIFDHTWKKLDLRSNLD